MKNDKEITCIVEFTEGAVDRITEAFVELRNGIINGIHDGPLMGDLKKASVTAGNDG